MSKPPSACYYLQNKSWFLPPPASPDEEPDALSTPFWCLKTHVAIGPDGEAACDESCTRDRVCYRPEVQL